MNSKESHTEKQLLLQIASGSEQAFRTLFDSHSRRLYAYVFSLVKSSQIAEELVMDVFIKLWLGRDLLTQVENFDGFLFRVAHNKTIDFLRSAAKDSRLKELLWEQIQTASDLLSDTPLIHHEYEAKIREAIELMPPQRKKIYKLSTEQELTHDQIASQLNISKSTVNNHLVEARRFIRYYLVNKLDIAMLLVVMAKI